VHPAIAAGLEADASNLAAVKFLLRYPATAAKLEAKLRQLNPYNPKRSIRNRRVALGAVSADCRAGFADDSSPSRTGAKSGFVS
jgi:hypothetical protein